MLSVRSCVVINTCPSPPHLSGHAKVLGDHERLTFEGSIFTISACPDSIYERLTSLG